MKIALYGASGMIGQRILREALQRGHDVTAIIRDPTKLTESGLRLQAVAGNILDPRSVAGDVTGHDAVVSAFAPNGGQDPSTLVEAARSLIEGMTRDGVKRLIMVGGAGSLEVEPGVQLVDTPDFPEFIKPVVLAHRDALDVLKTEADELEWSYFSPAALIAPGERTQVYRLGTDELIRDNKGNSSISAEDYAVAVLDELESPRFIRRRFTIGY